MKYTAASFCDDGVPLSKEQQVRTITDNFDFEKVYKVMKALDWKWYGDDETPSYGKLVNLATDLLLQTYSEAVRAYNQPSVSSSTGGFKVDARRFDSDIYLELSFVVASADIRDLVV